MNKIEIYDNVFSNLQIKKINEHINFWEKVFKNEKDYSTDKPFWTIHFDENLLFSKELFYIIETVTNKRFIVDRIYAIGQTFSQNSNFHTDNDNPKANTFCYYFNQYQDSGGNLFIKAPAPDKFIISIDPIFNRGVFFPSTYYHCGSGVNIDNNQLRICIVWKLIEIE
jgi:hypothetical protein